MLVKTMAFILKRTIFAMVILMLATGLGSCGSSSSSRDQNEYEPVPVNVSLQDEQLSAGTSTTIIYTIPAADKPYNQIRIDLKQTLQEANLVVNPAP